MELSKEYTDAHKILLQYLWGKRVVSEEEMKDFFTRIVECFGLPASSNLNAFIRTVCLAIEGLSFTVRCARRRSDNAIFWVLVNTKNDQVAENFASNLTPGQIGLMKVVIELLTAGSGGSSQKETNGESDSEASSETSRPRKKRRNRSKSQQKKGVPSSKIISKAKSAESKLKASESQLVLDNLISEGWLEIDDEGLVSLSTRACFELKPILDESEYDTGYEF